MSTRRHPDRFTCKGCAQEVVKAPPPARDIRTDYCSKQCKEALWWKQHPRAYVRELSCQRCSATFRGEPRTRYCELCRVKQAQPTVPTMCAVCDTVFARKSSHRKATCSRACGRKLSGRSHSGQKHPKQIREHQCRDCRGLFIGPQIGRCPACQAINKRKHHVGGNHCQRARKAGVPRDYSITSTRVFDRDGWRCRLCGCVTPKQLKGSYQPNAPELDHIIPLSVGRSNLYREGTAKPTKSRIFPSEGKNSGISC
jgi:hypothetical protein